MRKVFVVALGITTLGTLAAAERASATVKCHNQCVRTYTDSNGVSTCQHYLQRCENVNVPSTPAQRADLRALNVERKRNSGQR